MQLTIGTGQKTMCTLNKMAENLNSILVRNIFRIICLFYFVFLNKKYLSAKCKHLITKHINYFFSEKSVCNDSCHNFLLYLLAKHMGSKNYFELEPRKCWFGLTSNDIIAGDGR